MITQERIKELCEQQGTTVTALERKLNISNGALKKDGPLKSDRLNSVAEELGVSMEYLVGATNDPTPLEINIEKWDISKREEHISRLLAYYIGLRKLSNTDGDILSMAIPADEKEVLLHYRKADDVTKEMIRRLLDIQQY